MSKYYDRLVKMNESLDAELHAKGIDVSTANRVDNTNNASKNGENEIVLEEGNEDEKVEVSADSLTDEQKKDAIKQAASDAGLDTPKDETLNEIVKDPDSMKAVQDVLGGEKANESDDDISEEVVIRMDDDDLDMHGYLKSDDGLDVRELEWTDDIKAAKVFQHEEMGQNAIEAICYKFHYDPSTFKTVSVDPRADEPYEDDDSEKWVTLDPIDVTATTLAD